MVLPCSIICDDASYDLAEAIAKDLGVDGEKIVKMERTGFEDGEFKLRFSRDVKSEEVILVLRLYPHVNDNIIEMILALKKLNDIGKSIKVVLPYLAYARQDKEFLPGEIASIYVLGDIMAHYGVKELVVIDVHNLEIMAKMGIKASNISAIGILAERLRESGLPDKPIVISPDKGSVERSRIFAEAIGAEYAYLEKHRDRVTGDVTTEYKELGLSGRTAVIFDDMMVSGGTVINAAKIARANGASRIIAVCTHALLIDGAAEKLKAAGVDEIIASNTISNDFSEADVSHLISEALRA